MSSESCVRACVNSLLVIATAFVALPLLPAPLLAQALLPTPPQAFLDTTYAPPTGQIIAVPAGGNFQGALNSAQPGDVITLQAGATFTGPFTLPVKSGSGWIIVRTSAADSSIPAQGKRMTPSYAAQLPKIVTPSTGPAIQTASGAHHFRFVAVEIALASSATYS